MGPARGDDHKITREVQKMEKDPYDLRGKVAMVTGGSRGIGRHLAIFLAKRGVSVAVGSRNLEECEKVVREILAKGEEARAFFLDVSDPKSISRMVQGVLAWKGRVDILINNAGTNVRKPALDFSEEEWDLIMDTNLKGAFFCAQEVARAMIRGGGGKILNVSSAAGGMPVPWLAPYSISKAGLNQMTRILALEWARYNIRVNAIAPSYIETPLTREWLKDPKRYEMLTKRSPMRRLGTLSDLEGAVLLLVSDASAFITGQVIFIDGGSSAGWALDWERSSQGEKGGDS